MVLGTRNAIFEANKRDEVDVLADSAVRASAVAAAMTEVAKLNPNTTNLDLGALGPRKKRLYTSHCA